MTKVRSGIAVAGTLILAVGTWIAVDATPRPPTGASPLGLRTYPFPFAFPWEPRACALGLFAAVEVVRDGDEVAFEFVESGARAPILFPDGFAAWSVGGIAVLVSPEGYVLAREGDVLDGLGGAAGENGDLRVCFASPDTYDEVVRGM